MDKKKIFIIIIISFHSLCYFGKSRIEIFLSFNECLSCYSALSTLNRIPEYTKILFIRREDSLIAKEFLENYLLPNDIEIKHIDQNFHSSFCKTFFNELLSDSFSLKELPNKIKTSNQSKLISNDLITLKLPKNINLFSERLSLMIDSNNISIFDYVLNKSIVLKLSNNLDSITNYKSINGKDFQNSKLVKLAHIDSIFYDKCHKELLHLGKGKANIESSYVKGNSLFLLLNFPIPVMVDKDWDIFMSFFIYELNLINNKNHLSFIDFELLNSKYNYRYFIDNTRPFYTSNSKLIFSLTDEQRNEDSICLFSIWNRNSKDEYVFEQLHPFQINKKEYLKQNLDSFEIKINNSYYFNYKLGILYDYKQSLKYNLSMFDLKAMTIQDIIKSDNKFNLIELKNEKILFTTIDLTTNKIESRLIELPVDINLVTCSFLNDKTIITINKKNTQLYVKRIIN
jgi:hypothetical protein